MKLVAVDNFNRDEVADRLVADNITDEREGLLILKALRATCDEYSTTWYKLMPDYYRLSRGMEDLV